MEPIVKKGFKGQLYGQSERIARPVASARRLELLEVLSQGERTVEKLAQETGMSVANTSQHLQVLRTAQSVEVRRCGVSALYRLSDERVFRLCRAIQELAEARLAEVERVVRTYLHDRSSLQPISAGELLDRLRQGSIVVLDVRPRKEFQAGHIPGTRSIPVAELESRLQEIPADEEVIAYCRGRYCVFADEAVALLRRHGFQARRLDPGLPDWRALGLPVEIAP